MKNFSSRELCILRDALRNGIKSKELIGTGKIADCKAELRVVSRLLGKIEGELQKHQMTDE